MGAVDTDSYISSHHDCRISNITKKGQNKWYGLCVSLLELSSKLSLWDTPHIRITPDSKLEGTMPPLYW